MTDISPDERIPSGVPSMLQQEEVRGAASGLWSQRGQVQYPQADVFALFVLEQFDSRRHVFVPSHRGQRQVRCVYVCLSVCTGEGEGEGEG